MSSVPKSYLKRFLSGDLDKCTFITKGCLKPKSISITDSVSGLSRLRYVDCGHCINCINERRFEWVSRMCLHSLYYKHCYFITLTYGTFDATQYDKHPFLQMWYDTLPTYNDYNKFHKFLPGPSVLVQSHATKFLKRLRLLCPGDLSYVYCGEYGSDYGRPHFHFIIWSDSVISYDSVCSAWSLKCVSTKDPRVVVPYRGKMSKNQVRFDFLIGMVKYYDLVSNGTLDFSSVTPNNSINGVHCFNYVASYVTKYNVDTFPPIVYRKLSSVYETFDNSEFYSDDHQWCPLKQLTFNNIYYESINYSDFLKLVAPCFNFSRKYSIGKRYFIENSERFKRSNFSLPKFCGKTLSFPRYYYYLLSLESQPLRIEKLSFCGRSYVKGNYKVLLSNLETFLTDPSLFLTKKFAKTFDLNVFYTDSKNGNFFHGIVYFDYQRYHFRYSSILDVFEFSQFNSSSKCFDTHFYLSRIDFLEFLIGKLEKCINDYNSMQLDIQFDCDVLRNNLIKDNFDIVQNYLDRYQRKQNLYKVKHISKSDIQ